MLDMLIALAPAVVWGIYAFGLRALVVMLCGVVGSVVGEYVFRLIMKKPFSLLDLSAVVSGLMVGLTLPASVPLWYPLVGGIFASVVLKQLFGGLGRNLVNPALTVSAAWVLISGFAVLYPTPFEAMAPFALNAEFNASESPLVALHSMSIPETAAIDLFLGSCTGNIGEISAMLILLGGIYLIVRRVVRWQIPVAYLGTLALATFLIPRTTNSVDFMLTSVLSGGAVFAAFFALSDPTTSPMTDRGRLIYGVGCGLLTLGLRLVLPGGIGMPFAVIAMNLLTPLIDRFIRPAKFGGVTKNGK